MLPRGLPLGTPDVSVVVPARNEATLIKSCLAALAVQQTGISFEVVVVDSASTDETAEIAGASGAVVVRVREPGQLLAKHLGVVAARGRIVCVLDADCVADPHWIAAVWRHFGSPGHEHVVATTNYYEFGRDLPAWGRWYVSFVRGTLVSIYRRLFRSMPFVLGGNVAFRREAYFAAGGYPLDGGIGQTEIGLARRMARVGIVTYLPEMRVTSSARRFRDGWFAFAFRYKLAEYFLPLTGYALRNLMRPAKAEFVEHS